MELVPWFWLQSNWFEFRNVNGPGWWGRGQKAFGLCVLARSLSPSWQVTGSWTVPCWTVSQLDEQREPTSPACCRVQSSSTSQAASVPVSGTALPSQGILELVDFLNKATALCCPGPGAPLLAPLRTRARLFLASCLLQGYCRSQVDFCKLRMSLSLWGPPGVVFSVPARFPKTFSASKSLGLRHGWRLLFAWPSR